MISLRPVLASLIIAPGAFAQQPSMAGMSMSTTTAVSTKALRQIAQVKQGAKALETQDAAMAAGFHPVLNWLPTMGVHWINRRRQGTGGAIDIGSPDQLMFSPIDGKQELVGAAYSFIVPLRDSARPATFDGNPMWHDHPQFAPEGETLAMLHVWFVPSPDGPFAGHNPNLPFWALGMTPPDADRFADPVESIRIRKAALALAVVADTAGLFPTLMQRPEVHAVIVAQREAIRALMPRLDAKGVTDWASWDRVADNAAVRWDTVRAAYLATVRTPAIRERMTRVMDEMETGKHNHMM
jgi:hypothetical protein